jgi:lysozyme family protein
MINGYDEDYEKAFTALLPLEGGYINDPHDKGGETNRGITKAFLLSMADKYDQFKGVNVKDLTEEQTKELYYLGFWKPLRIGEMPETVCSPFFNFAVNAGAGTAVRILQQSVNDFNAFYDFEKRLKEDGIIGNETINTMDSLTRIVVYGQMQLEIIFRSKTADHYRRIVLKNPDQERFLEDWLRRAWK